MTRRLIWKQVDVFADRPLCGSPLAVFFDGRGLDAGEMWAVTKELNLPEVSFVLPPMAPDAAYRLRAFTTLGEKPVVDGNALLGSAFVLAEQGAFPLFEPLTTVYTETPAGVVPVEIEVSGGRPQRAAVAQTPPPALDRVYGRPGSPVVAAIAAAVGVDPSDLTNKSLYPQMVDTGTWHLLVCLDDLVALSNIAPDLQALGRIGEQISVASFGFFASRPLDVRAQAHLRVFTPKGPSPESPASASAAAALGAYLARWQTARPERGGLVRFIIEQGVEIERPSLIDVLVGVDPLDREAFTVRVSGACTTVASGELVLR